MKMVSFLLLLSIAIGNMPIDGMFTTTVRRVRPRTIRTPQNPTRPTIERQGINLERASQQQAATAAAVREYRTSAASLEKPSWHDFWYGPGETAQYNEIPEEKTNYPTGLTLNKINPQQAAKASTTTVRRHRTSAPSVEKSTVNDVESKYDAIMKELKNHIMPWGHQINDLLKASSKANYPIINREDSDGITLLGYICVIAASELGKNVLEFNKGIIDACVKGGAVLSYVDRLFIRDAVHIALAKMDAVHITLMKKIKFWMGWHISNTRYSIGFLKEYALLFDQFIQLGADLSHDIDVEKLQRFVQALHNTEQFPYIDLSPWFEKTGISKEGTLNDFTINDIEKRIKTHKVPKIEDDIPIIMNYLAARGLAQDNDDITYQDDNQTKTLSLEKLKKAAQEGILRMSLIEELGFGKERIRIQNYTPGVSQVGDMMYDLLMQSHKIELRRILNEYANLCNNASFIKEQSKFEAETEYKKSSSHEYGTPVGTRYTFAKILSILDLPAHSTKATMEKARKAYLMENHPDKLRGKSQEDIDAITTDVKELNALYKDYKRQEQQSAERE